MDEIRSLTEEEARELHALSMFKKAFGGSLTGEEYAAVYNRARSLIGLPKRKDEALPRYPPTRLERR